MEHLLAMDWSVPGHRRILEMEGLRRWVRPDGAQMQGYTSLFDAMWAQGVADGW